MFLFAGTNERDWPAKAGGWLPEHGCPGPFSRVPFLASLQHSFNNYLNLHFNAPARVAMANPATNDGVSFGAFMAHPRRLGEPEIGLQERTRDGCRVEVARDQAAKEQ
ncbi:MAG: hypothetical protein WCQ21_04125 [Verrucomicrobiota bacterium]|jgi:hypothetical protein